jgi:hypothetical protein
MDRDRDDGRNALALASRLLGGSSLDGAWFDLGGSSIDAARLVSALDQDLGLRLGLRDLLDAPSVRELLATLPSDSCGSDSRGSDGNGPDQEKVERLWSALAQLPAGQRLTVAQLLLSVAAMDGAATASADGR